MTKFKKFLMAHGAILMCNSAELARDENFDVEFIIPRVTDTGFAISYCHVDDHVPDIVVYDRFGACSYIDRSEYQPDILDSYCDTEFATWMCNTSYKISSTLFTVAVGMYKNDKKVRVAFKHMRAGIMDEKVFYEWLVRQYPKHIRSV